MRAFLVLLMLAGCGDDATTDTPPVDASPITPPLPDAGLGPWACEPGELLIEDGSCIPAGIAPEDCPEGFLPTGDRACEPELVECPSGTMALAGESVCRPVATCNTASKWGDIPVETDTQYVDASFVGGNGSAQAPWSSVQQAVDSAADQAIVAIAAGSYVEDVSIQGKRVRLWGVCPDLVDIVGTLSLKSDQSEVHTLAVSAPLEIGVHIGPGNDVLIDRVWVHNAGIIGIDIEGGNPSARIVGSLVEQSKSIGVFGYGAGIVVEDSVLRDIGPSSSGGFGQGVRVFDDDNGIASTLTVRRSRIERVLGGGIQGFGSDVVVEDTVVRDVAPSGDGEIYGSGIMAVRFDETAVQGSLVVRGAYVESTHFAGIFAANSDATIERAVVRGVERIDAVPSGNGIALIGANGLRGNHLTARAVVVEGTRVYGIVAGNGAALVESAIVRDTIPYAAADAFGSGVDVGGRGIGIESYEESAGGYLLELRGSRIERTHEMGIGALGGDIVVTSTLVSDVKARDTDGYLGRGINVQPSSEGGGANATIRDSLIERAQENGIAIAEASALIESTWVRDTLPSKDGHFGRGISVQGFFNGGLPAQATIVRVLVENNADVGIMGAAADVTIEHSIVRGTRPNDNDFFGDGAAAISLLRNGETYRASVHIVHSIVAENARAGAGTFGADLSLEGVLLDCNGIDLNGDPLEGIDYDLDDLGSNVCSCGTDVHACKARSAGLAPPVPSGL